MGQTGSVEQKSALRDVMALRPGVGKIELEEVLRTFCALFPLEQQEVGLDDANAGASSNGVDLKERRVFDVVHALLQEQTEHSERSSNRDMIDLLLMAFRRVIRWRELYKLCAKCSVKPFLSCLHRQSPALVLAALDTLALMLGVCPTAVDGVDKTAERNEAANRRNFGDAGGFEVLRALLVQHGAAAQYHQEPDSAAVLAGVFQLFRITLISRRAVTDLVTSSLAVEALLNARVTLLELCHYTDDNTGAGGIQHAAMELVRELFCIIDLDQVHELQESAREYGALLYALETALQELHPLDDDASRDAEQQELRDSCAGLVELFCAGNTRSKKVMYRIFPVELFIPAESRAELLSRHTPASPASSVASSVAPSAKDKIRAAARSARSLPHFSFDFEQPRRSTVVGPLGTIRASNGDPTKLSSVVMLALHARHGGTSGVFERWLADARAQGEQWCEILEAVGCTHERPELVWREPMRSELRCALRTEIETLERRRRNAMEDEGDGGGGGVVTRWEHEMFYVEYPSMHAELLVHGYFIEYLIPRVADLTTSFEIAEPVVLAWHLSDQLAVERDPKWALLCVRCLRLMIRRYAMLFHGQLPTRHVLSLLRDHANHAFGSLEFVRECFLLLHTAIMTTRNAPSESFNRLCTTITHAAVDVLADPALLSVLSIHQDVEQDGEIDEGHEDEVAEAVRLADPEDAAILVNNERDAVVRAGVSLLLAIVQRAKFALRLVRPKRVFICRLLAVETLDHATIARLLFILKQLSLLNGNDGAFASGSSSHLSTASSSSISSSMASFSAPSKDAHWKSLALVYVLLASCDPKGMGMCVAAAEFLKENYALRPLAGRATALKGPHSNATSSEFNDLLDEALGCGGCGMGRLLDSASAEAFSEVFNAHQKRAADVNWGRKQRVRLYRYLKGKYVSAGERQQQHRESTSMWSSYAAFADGAAADQHVEDDDLFVGNIFLRSYIEGDGEFLNEWTPEMYRDLINALFEQLVWLGRVKSTYIGGGDKALASSGQPSSGNSGISSGGASSSNGAACSAEPWEVQVLILKALARLVPSHCADVEIRTEFYHELLGPLRRSMLSEVDQVRGILSLELFVAVLSVPEERSVNTAACRLFLEETGLSALAEALTRMRSPMYQQLLSSTELLGPGGRGIHNTQNMARVLIYRALDVVSALAGHHAAGLRALTKNPDVVMAILELASRKVIMQHADIDSSTVCLSCIGALCHSTELRALVVAGGGLLSLLDIVSSCPAEDVEEAEATLTATAPLVTEETPCVVKTDAADERGDADTSNDDEDEEAGPGTSTHSTDSISATSRRGDENGSSGETSTMVVQRKPSRYFGAVRSAALALRACLDAKDSDGPASLPTQVLNQLLTPSLVRVLRMSPDRFILQLQSSEDIISPTLVWTASMRQRLQECVAREQTKVKAAATASRWPRWNPEHLVAADSFRYQYPELADELILHDVYLSNFVATPGDDVDLDGMDMSTFSEALLISIQSHENVLRILQQRGASDPAKETATRLMRQAMDKLVRAHPHHNLEVDATGDAAPFSDDSLPASPTTADGFAQGDGYVAVTDREWNATRFARMSSSGIEDLTV